MRILVIPEDFRNDQYILKPLFVRLFANLGRPRANIRICQDPLLGGVGEALKSERIREIVEQHGGMTDIFILCVDRDGIKGRRTRLDQIEAEFEDVCTLLAENAWEEIETWVLAGLTLPPDWTWTHVRREVHVKETFFVPFVQERGVADSPGGGRKMLGEEAAGNIPSIRQKCREDFDALAMRLETVLGRYRAGVL